MAEPISTAAILVLLKAIGAKAIIAKVGLAIKGFMFTAKGKSLLLLAKHALVYAKSHSLIEVAIAVSHMLIVLDTVAAGTMAAIEAEKALKCFSEGRIKDGFKHAAKAGWQGKGVHSGIKYG